MPDIIHLLRQRHHTSLLADAVAEIGRQGFRHIGDLHLPVNICLSADGLQGIVQKMRLDLPLQIPDFRLPDQHVRLVSLFIINNNAVNQPFQFAVRHNCRNLVQRQLLLLKTEKQVLPFS